ncbi:MAG: recombinase family protein [Clostridia bacterium]|nr:recombinase family protein [Clostridia bacterium]
MDGQLRVCEEYAQRNNILILNTYIDRAMTGTNDNRPDFQRMIKESSRKEWNYVLVYKLDRFSRNKYETAIHKKTLRDNGVKLLSAMENIPDTPEGIILESLLEGINQYYSAELAQKVSRGMKETRRKGLYQGGAVLYGYKIDGRNIVIDENEAEVVRYMYSQYAKGEFVREIIPTDIYEKVRAKVAANRYGKKSVQVDFF